MAMFRLAVFVAVLCEAVHALRVGDDEGAEGESRPAAKHESFAVEDSEFRDSEENPLLQGGRIAGRRMMQSPVAGQFRQAVTKAGSGGMQAARNFAAEIVPTMESAGFKPKNLKVPSGPKPGGMKPPGGVKPQNGFKPGAPPQFKGPKNFKMEPFRQPKTGGLGMNAGFAAEGGMMGRMGLATAETFGQKGAQTGFMKSILGEAAGGGGKNMFKNIFRREARQKLMTAWSESITKGQSAAKNALVKVIGESGFKLVKGVAKATWDFFMILALGDKLKDVFDVFLFGPGCGRLSTVFVASFVPKFADSMVHQSENIELDVMAGKRGARGHEQWLKECLRDMELHLGSKIPKSEEVLAKLEAAVGDGEVLKLAKAVVDPGTSYDNQNKPSYSDLISSSNFGILGSLAAAGTSAAETARTEAHGQLVKFVGWLETTDLDGDPGETADFEQVKEFYNKEKERLQAEGKSGMQVEGEAIMSTSVGLAVDLFNNYVGPNGDICENMDENGASSLYPNEE